MKRKIVIAIVLGAVVAGVWWDRRPQPEHRGTQVGQTVPAEAVLERVQRQQRALRSLSGETPETQILFGDLHVHTTFSVDAFAWSLPIFGGEGVHPPAEACDYARHCASLDFWASTEHAESLTARHWSDLKAVVRQCNAAAGDPADPDLVTFLGWEWTQMGYTPETHYGHKNVIFRGTDDDAVPARPIGAGGVAATAMRSRRPLWQDALGPYTDFANRQSQFNQHEKMRLLRAQPICEVDVPVRALPADCSEFATTPEELFAKLDDWGYERLVIPHGNTWGFYTPPGSSWDKQLTRRHHDPDTQRLIEVYSGHGSAESYRRWREIAFDADGAAVCPEPTDDYLPSCWQAGEIIRQRCGELPTEICEQRVVEARQHALAAGIAGHHTVPGNRPEDWLDAGQCRDCFLPAFNHRPTNSVQYALAISNFDEVDETGEDPLRFRFGFIGSSDNHSARPGTGFKHHDRKGITDVYGQEGQVRKVFVEAPRPKGTAARSQPFDLQASRFNFLQVAESERVQSYFFAGGLAAVHSAGRSRDAIWEALQRRQVYATSGERILLWFDLLGDEGREAPMGSVVEAEGVPHFRVRAVGAFEQAPGCPEQSLTGLGVDAVERLCRGECYNPTDRRQVLDRIEVVRILPQAHPDEEVGDLIEDPWQVFPCSGDPRGCTVEFADPDPRRVGREALYYVRAIQRPSATVNAAGLRCEHDAQGQCIAVKPCFGDNRTPPDDDCQAPAEHRAWSSPIFIQDRGAPVDADGDDHD